jgi:4-hydroxybutyrate CoA-transferase
MVLKYKKKESKKIMSWQEIYQSKLVSMEDAVSLIRPDDRIFYSFGGSAPPDLINAISAKLPELGKVRFQTGISFYLHDYLFKPECKGFFEHHTIFPFVTERFCTDKEDIYPYPFHLSQLNSVVDKMKPDVLLCECPPPDENGYLNYSFYGTCSNDYVSKQVSKIIVQVNKNAPYIYGEQNGIHVSEVTAIVEKDHDFYELPQTPITEIESKIARFVVDRIEDGATIQVGIGGLANAICSFLDCKKDLGVHSEMFVDAMMPLIQKGVINGSRKSIHPEETTVAFGGTTNAALKFLHKNPTVKMYPVSHINDPKVVGMNDNFVSVNNAIVADLTGQVGSESIGFRQYSGTGGQVDFVRGARMSKNGKSFLALESCANTKEGEVSKIVLSFKPGQVVTTTRTDVDMILTEYGVAEMRNKSLRERAKAMIAIAHPQFRDELASEAKKVGIL